MKSLLLLFNRLVCVSISPQTYHDAACCICYRSWTTQVCPLQPQAQAQVVARVLLLCYVARHQLVWLCLYWVARFINEPTLTSLSRASAPAFDSSALINCTNELKETALHMACMMERSKVTPWLWMHAWLLFPCCACKIVTWLETLTGCRSDWRASGTWCGCALSREIWENSHAYLVRSTRTIQSCMCCLCVHAFQTSMLHDWYAFIGATVTT